MAEGGVIIPDEPTAPGPSSGPINTPEAQEYWDMIEKIFDDFKDLLKEDCKDALVVMTGPVQAPTTEICCEGPHYHLIW